MRMSIGSALTKTIIGLLPCVFQVGHTVTLIIIGLFKNCQPLSTAVALRSSGPGPAGGWYLGPLWTYPPIGCQEHIGSLDQLSAYYHSARIGGLVIPSNSEVISRSCQGGNFVGAESKTGIVAEGSYDGIFTPILCRSGSAG